MAETGSQDWSGRMRIAETVFDAFRLCFPVKLVVRAKTMRESFGIITSG
jgi:hypothetical protein